MLRITCFACGARLILKQISALPSQGIRIESQCPGCHQPISATNMLAGKLTS